MPVSASDRLQPPRALVPRRELGGYLAFFALWVAVTAIALLLSPNPAGHGTHQALGLPPCGAVLLFDRPCPGCGLTTSWTALLNGDVRLAFRSHTLGPPLYLIFTLGSFLCAYGWIRQTRAGMDTVGFNRLLVAVTVIFILFGAGRMAVMSNFGTETEDFVARTTGIRR
jgi:hypothetical protein